MASDAPRGAAGDSGDGEYRFWEHRSVKYPTTDVQTVINLAKGFIGVGIFSMPQAFYHTGLVLGIVYTMVAGFFCTYGIHQLVKSAQMLCVKFQQPSMQYAEVAEKAFEGGPQKLQRCSNAARCSSKYVMFTCWTGVCIVFIILVASNIKHVVDYYTQSDYDLTIYIVILWPFFVILILVKHLKFVAIYSLIAVLIDVVAFAITISFFFEDGGTPRISDRDLTKSVLEAPKFFAIAIFAIQAIGVVLPLENTMKTPLHFTGCNSVLSYTTICVLAIYAFMGFFGYLKYGEDTNKVGSVMLNLPPEDGWAQSVNILMAISNFLSFSLQFYVPQELLFTEVKKHFNEKHEFAADMITRCLLVSICVGFAALLPNLIIFISLIGAVFLSTLGLLFPSIIYMIAHWTTLKTSSKICMVLGNIVVLAFGVMALLTGSYYSTVDILKFYEVI